MSDAGLLLQVVFAVGGGIISFVSPCVLPMVPAYLGMMSGYSVTDLDDGVVARRRVLVATLLFVLGFTVVFVALGAAATSIGQFLRENQVVSTRIAGVIIIVFGVLMVAMAWSHGGFLASMSRERRIDVTPSRLGRWAPPLMGVTFAFGWTPCIGPILGTILALSSTRDTVGQGVLLLGAYSLGLGIPFVLSGLFVRRALRAFGRLRRHLRVITTVSGVVMVAFGVLLLTNQVGRIAGFFIDFLDGIPILRNLT
ncbi:MAG: cytochrome c biogenesis protein CcdA, partial [Acidimicrobiia bacterium]|nr:cytochrome c biogenesis protein CcdA [Acidimicrobiia bacterium]